MNPDAYGFGILTLFMLGVFALLLIIIWVFSREGDKQRAYDSERMKVFEVSQEKNFGVIATALKETVSPLARRVEETFERVEEGLVITKTGFEQANQALTTIKETQAKELGIDMDTKSLLESVAKEINDLQAKVGLLETTSNQQFSDLKTSVATLQAEMTAMVQLVKTQLEKVKPE